MSLLAEILLIVIWLLFLPFQMLLLFFEAIQRRSLWGEAILGLVVAIILFTLFGLAGVGVVHLLR